MREDQSGKQNSAETIRWENFAKFVHQFSHDLRNQLNAAELQSALVGELNKEGDLKPDDLRTNQLVFLYTDLPHNDVLAKHKTFREFLNTSCLERMEPAK